MHGRTTTRRGMSARADDGVDYVGGVELVPAGDRIDPGVAQRSQGGPEGGGPEGGPEGPGRSWEGPGGGLGGSWRGLRRGS